MEIKPCKDDTHSLLGVCLVVVLCEIVLLYIRRFEPIFVIAALLVNTVLGIGQLRDLVYLYRTISIDSEGCTFSFRKWSKRYGWADLKVQLCEEKHFRFYDSDISGPGILICPKSLNCTGKIPYMTFCRYKSPFSSVYIRYKTPEDERKTIHGKNVYYGYTAEREMLTDYLQSIDVSPQKI